MKTLAIIVREYMLRTVVESGYDVARAAKTLGISRMTLYRQLERWKLPTPLGGPPGVILHSEHKKRCQAIKTAHEEACKSLKS